ncbi:MAG: histidine triad nucleotide-binding protein [Bdellovibrionales bacterium]|nr:histidine triad nucleotide-binding protein [Bdellovibrionales bacterium]
MESNLGSTCIFCKIIKGEVPCQQVASDEHFLAFNDIYPQAPVHILIIPKRHISSIVECNQEDQSMLGSLLLTAKMLASSHGLDRSGYRLNINAGKDGGQSVSHLHLHLLGGRAFNWPPG